MPFFSVIIPLYNKEKYILRTLQSVSNQTFKDFEIIIVDDGSTDNSIAAISTTYDKRIILIKQQNQGVSNARNNAINAAKGDYMALLDADDLWHNNHLEKLKESIITFPNAGLYCNNYEIKRQGGLISPAVIPIAHKNKPLVVKDYFTSSLINSVAWSSSVAFNKVDFDNVGKFNPEFLTGEDIDLWIRFALQYEVIFNPNITMTYSYFDPLTLSNILYNHANYLLIKNYEQDEIKNPSLKKYLDINRYGLALKCLLNSEKKLYKILKKEINYDNLNYKQRLLLNTPKLILRFLKKFQYFLLKNKLYLTAYK